MIRVQSIYMCTGLPVWMPWNSESSQCTEMWMVMGVFRVLNPGFSLEALALGFFASAAAIPQTRAAHTAEL